MLKQSSSRNQKAKGSSKLKVPLQICLLIAIGIWLLYQAKHFRDQMTALAEESSENEVVDRVFKLGRKNLNPRLGDLGRGFQKHDEEEMEISEDEENKVREEEEDEMGVGNQEKIEEGAEREQEQLEDLIDRDDSED